MQKGEKATLWVCAAYDSDHLDANYLESNRREPPVRNFFRGQEIRLEELDKKNVIGFTRKWFPDIVCPPDSWDTVVDFVGRRPLLVRQGLRYLQNNGYIALKQGQWSLAHDFYEDPGVKSRRDVDESTGLGMLMAEYRRLWNSHHAEEQQIATGLRIAAAIGAEFEYEVWEQVVRKFLGCSDMEVMSLLHQLTRRDFVAPLSNLEHPGVIYQITPPVLQHYLLLEIQKDPIWATRLHPMIAEALPPTNTSPQIKARRAYQLLWSQKPDCMKEASQLFYHLALDQENHQSLDVTIVFFQRALEAARKSHRDESFCDRIHYVLAQTLDARGAWEQAYREAVAVATKCEERGLAMRVSDVPAPSTSPEVSASDQKRDLLELAAEAYILAGWVSQELYETERALKHYQQAEDILKDEACQELSETRARLWRKQAAWCAERDQLDLAVNYYKRALHSGSQFVLDRVQTYGSYAEVLRRLKRIDMAQAQMRTALKILTTIRDGTEKAILSARIYIQAGRVWCTLNPDQSISYLERALGLAKALGALKEWALAEEWLGIVKLGMTEYSDDIILMHCACAAELYDILGDRKHLHTAALDYIDLLIVTQRYDFALQIIEMAERRGLDTLELRERRCKVQSGLKNQLPIN